MLIDSMSNTFQIQSNNISSKQLPHNMEAEQGLLGAILINNEIFYSLYGHLKTPHKIQLGQKILAGQELARIGKETDSGGWFCHLHLQIITQKAMNEGYSEWGYISEKLLSKVEEYFPNPNSLFKW